jgi:hypothetical protein
MRFDTEHGIQALYQAAQGQYRELSYSTVSRDFVVNSQLINPPREFVPDIIWHKSGNSNYTIDTCIKW